MNRHNERTRKFRTWIVELLICTAVVGAIWTKKGVQDLRNSSDRREAELVQFRNLVETARKSPARELDRISSDFNRRLTGQNWYRSLGAARPRVLKTELGLLVRFASVSSEEPSEK